MCDWLLSSHLLHSDAQTQLHCPHSLSMLVVQLDLLEIWWALARMLIASKKHIRAHSQSIVRMNNISAFQWGLKVGLKLSEFSRRENFEEATVSVKNSLCNFHRNQLYSRVQMGG